MPVSIVKLKGIAGVAVVVAALGSGYFMQNAGAGAPNAKPKALATDQIPVAPAALAVADEPAVTRGLSQPILTLPETPPGLPVPAAPESGTTLLAATTPTEPLGGTEMGTVDADRQNCQIGFTATAAPGAMVDLTIEAPCHAGQQVDILHAGIRFSERLDQSGIVEVSVPALEENAFFSARFSDDQTAAADILMPTVGEYQRSVLLWQGDSGFSLYALERGAEYGEPGMVSAEQPYGPQRAIAGEGGFFTLLGADKNGYHTAVYSWPLRLNGTAPAPEINVEAEVLNTTCGRQINASFLTTVPGQRPETEPLFMAVPGCDSIGEYLVLKNLSQAVRIATN